MDKGSTAEPPPFEIVVRAALPTERAACARFLCARLVEDGLAVDADGVARAVELALSQGSSAWLVLALSGGLPVGVMLANPVVSAARGGAALWVEELYVARHLRRRGIGRALVEFIGDEARKNGMRALEIEAGGATGAEVLARLGFTRLERTRCTRPL